MGYIVGEGEFIPLVWDGTPNAFLSKDTLAIKMD